MTRHSIRHIILFLILLLASCGVKRDVVSQPEQDGMVDKTVVSVASEDVALSLEQRIAAGEFAWLDTIAIDTSGVWMNYCSGHYVLAHQNDSIGGRLPLDVIPADSLVMNSRGYYWKYKNDSLVDYGRYRVWNYAKRTICWEQYRVDMEKGVLTNELERHPIELESSFIESYSCDKSNHCYWVRCNHHAYDFTSVPNRQYLEIYMDIFSDCFHSQRPGSNEIVWVIKK